VVLTAEHDVGFTPDRWRRYQEACAEASTDRLLVVPGIEYSDADNCVHLAVWGNLSFFGEGLETKRVLQCVREHSGVAVLAHPGRRHALERIPPSSFTDLTGIEIWNRKYDGWAPNAQAMTVAEEQGLVPFVGHDFHTARQFFPLAMTLKVEGLTVEHVYDALRHRQCEARAFRLPATRAAQGSPLVAFRGAERIRPPLARTVRMVMRK
jgi:hypothetical protein